MTIEPTDIAIFLVSFAACIYCIVLSRRLKALQNTKDGLGATIMALTKSVSAVSSATHDSRAHTSELAGRLTTLIKEAEEMHARLASLKREMEAMHDKTSTEAMSAQKELRSVMGNILQESRDRSAEMRALLKQMRSVTGVAASTIRNSDFLFDDEDDPFLKRTA